MKASGIEKHLATMESMMYGYNYETCFGIDVLTDCHTLNDVYQTLSQRYTPYSHDKGAASLVSEKEMWTEIDQALKFRGDKNSGLELRPENEQELLAVQNKYKAIINNYVSHSTRVFRVPEYAEGLPCYGVFWGYRFIILNTQMSTLYIYGSASD